MIYQRTYLFLLEHREQVTEKVRTNIDIRVHTEQDSFSLFACFSYFLPSLRLTLDSGLHLELVVLQIFTKLSSTYSYLLISLYK